MINITNEDNMDLMARYSDNHFDVGFVDPEYGIGASKPTKKPNKARQKNGTFLNIKAPEYTHKEWDNKPASIEYGKELFRISNNQIIWGANFFNWIVEETFKPPRRMEFDNFIKEHPKNWIIWDKVNGNSDQFDCELIWTSFNIDSVIIPYMWAGMNQGSMLDGSIMEGNKKLNENRFHPTQKPVRIYELIFHHFKSNYSEFYRLIKSVVDTGFGSGTIMIICYILKFDLTACEIDKEYYDGAVRRFELHKLQLKLF